MEEIPKYGSEGGQVGDCLAYPTAVCFILLHSQIDLRERAGPILPKLNSPASQAKFPHFPKQIPSIPKTI